MRLGPGGLSGQWPLPPPTDAAAHCSRSCGKEEQLSKDDYNTPLLDSLEKGPWPSFVTEMKRAAAKKPAAADALRLLEKSYRDKMVHWKHGGIVGVRGYGGGVIGRYTDSPEEFPEIHDFHTIRVNQPTGRFYTTKPLRTLRTTWAASGTSDLTT